MKLPNLASERFRTDLIARLFALRAHTAVVDRAIIAAVRFVDAQEQSAGERLSAAFSEISQQWNMMEELASWLILPVALEGEQARG